MSQSFNNRQTVANNDGPRFVAALPKSHMRVSPDSAWPLRRADGRTWAESMK